MSRRPSRGRYSAGVGKRDGTPTGEPVPQGLDDYSGFKVPLGKLEKDWQGLYSVSPDRRNPQDFVRGVKDDQSLPFARPEPPDEYVALPILWEDGVTIMTAQNGSGLAPAR